MAEDVLRKIYAAKAEHLKAEMAREPYEEIRERARASVASRRHFLKILKARSGEAIVAEIKRASPSAGLIARDFDPVATGKMYQRAGADAISILTESDHFLGDLAFLAPVRSVTALPILRKDFLTTPYQVAQSAAYGADAILLIVGGLTDEQMRAALQEAHAYELDALVEVHDLHDLERALALGVDFVGVNNRNLRTMITDLAVSEHILPQVPPTCLCDHREWDARPRRRGAAAPRGCTRFSYWRSVDAGRRSGRAPCLVEACPRALSSAAA